MAYFYRLIFLAVVAFSGTSAHAATVAPVACYQVTGVPCQVQLEALCTLLDARAVVLVYRPTYSPATGFLFNRTTCNTTTHRGWFTVTYPNGGTAGSDDPFFQLGFDIGTGWYCPPSYEYEAANGSTPARCVPVPCPVDLPFADSFSLGWVKTGETPYKRIPDPFCADVGTGFGIKYCMVRVDFSVVNRGESAKGFTSWFQAVDTKTTGDVCANPLNIPLAAAPACAGQVGVVNGLEVCLPVESEAAKEARARDAAAAAAAAASAAAAAAGATPAQAAAAGTAAGAAAGSAVRAGGTSAQGAAAGAAAGSSSFGGGSGQPGGTGTANAAAGAGAAAGAAAGSAAAAAGLSPSQAAAASAAASASASAIITNGGSAAAAAAAGSAAGAAAANGASSSGAAAAGAGAGAGASGGGGGGGGGGGEGVASSFSGSCGAAFACEGDALQCAMVREQHVRDCQLFDSPSDESALYDVAKAIDQTKSNIVATDVNISSSSFDTSNALGGGGCIADKSITVAGTSVSIPFSSICPYLENMGAVLMMVSFLLAIRIVSRG